MKINIVLFFTVMCCFLFSSCNRNNKGVWIVPDAGKDTVFVVNTNVKHPSSLILKITGETDDSVKVHQSPIAGGKISKELQIDHYDSRINVAFDHYKATKGKLQIEYFLP